MAQNSVTGWAGIGSGIRSGADVLALRPLPVTVGASAVSPLERFVRAFSGRAPRHRPSACNFTTISYPERSALSSGGYSPGFRRGRKWPRDTRPFSASGSARAAGARVDRWGASGSHPRDARRGFDPALLPGGGRARAQRRGDVRARRGGVRRNRQGRGTKSPLALSGGAGALARARRARATAARGGLPRRLHPDRGPRGTTRSPTTCCVAPSSARSCTAAPWRTWLQLNDGCSTCRPRA